MTDSAVRHSAEIRERCSRGDVALARAFTILGKRWSGVVVGSLSTGPAGFRELSRLVGGVSDSVLSDRLTELCDLGLVRREVDPGPPVSVSYSLTEAGEGLLPALNMIAEWAEKHLPEPPTSC
ncbi:helix-turn-helix domain-containing protein [Asanoa sp. WMMD1127]|uniref:winged helix-turn-helix transcriptional regulator n=1 Tax=Asanoa sp. WMMD1127 TaxID=3016107 RepID=UPI002417D248|nr:helix-turn-helix domain-containing protein [Asanoa sp. WMMD1127]MDG4826815.1 helix-turn-helix domain-containing protein [Asanoa sp. WMMD1127]